MRTRYGRPAFQGCGYIGFGAACALATGLARYGGLSLWIVAALAVSGAITFFALAMATKIVTGAETLTYYHHQTAILLVAALLLWRLRAPLLPFLDVTILSIGLFLVFGRIGCLKSGCCYGLPWHGGVRYSTECVASGFPRHLAEVPLLPVQAIESLWVLGIVCWGALQVVTGHPPGSALSSYCVLYAWGRFFLEFLRGGPNRPFFWRFSEAQWTSFAIVCGAVCAEALGILPLQPWHGAAIALIAVSVIALQLHPRLRSLHRLFHPLHIEEFAEALELVSDLAADDRRQSPVRTIHLASTKMGIQISCGHLIAGKTVRHYTLSQTGEAMSERTARCLATLVPQLTRSPQPVQVLAGRAGVFHLLMESVFRHPG
ncbi:MAG: prolipoprotein diacylglyceryl transferase family protein [Bryobacteraceae bacterium]|jgi:prolipoprotein diacylglyceryltransferase